MTTDQKSINELLNDLYQLQKQISESHVKSLAIQRELVQRLDLGVDKSMYLAEAATGRNWFVERFLSGGERIEVTEVKIKVI